MSHVLPAPSFDDEIPLLKTNARYYNVKELASILDISERTVYARIEEGKIQAVQAPYNKRGIKIPRAEVLRLVKLMQVPIHAKAAEA